MKSKCVLGLLAATALAGCNLAPKYVRPIGEVPAALPAGGVYPAAENDAPDVTKIGWRAFFTDDRLRSTIALGLENNRDLRIAAANVLQARAQYRIQRADLLPTVALSGSATVHQQRPGCGRCVGRGREWRGGSRNGYRHRYRGWHGHRYRSWYRDRCRDRDRGRRRNWRGDWVGIVRSSVLLAERRRVRIRGGFVRAGAQSQPRRAGTVFRDRGRATRHAHQPDRRDCDGVDDVCVRSGPTQDLAAIADVSFQQSLELTLAQFRIGVASELEARQAETTYQTARNDIAVLKTRLAQDKNALDLLVGAPIGPDLLPQGLGSGDSALNVLPGGISSDVLLRRPDVLQAEHQLVAQNANIGAARAALFPTISLTATVGTISTALSGLFAGGSFTYTGAPSIALPIFDGGRRRGNLRSAEAQQQAAVATYERAVQTAFREVADALAQRGTIDEQVAAQTARVNAATAALRISDARYRAGVESFLNTLDSQRYRLCRAAATGHHTAEQREQSRRTVPLVGRWTRRG